jgi:alkanesulfonate monooxygenase SsuD/methylene tetrahydromethanopterin reductase-like flavin-dependent oxidoreductase (luciferase family)
VKIGLFHTVQWPEGSEQQQRYRDALEQAILAERLGFESVWLTEHHFTRHGITSDSLAVLAYLAGRTDRIRLGTAVLVLPFHDPVRLAESTAIIDNLSDGRLDVGIGRGYQWTEYHGFGIGFDEGSDRFEEALELLLQSWSAIEPFAFEGKFHRYEAAFPQPRPVQRPHPPLWHATTSEASLARCVENDWGVMLSQATPLASVEEALSRYRALRRAAGRDDSLERVVLARGMYCARTDDEARAAFLGPYAEFFAAADRVSAPPGSVEGAAPHNPFELTDGTGLLDTAVCGSPESCRAELERLAAVGIENVILFVNLGSLSHHDVVASLELFGSEVLPHFLT